MSGLNQIRQRQTEWEQRSPGNGGNRLFLREGDLVFAHFISSGEDDDPYFEIFMAHEIPPTQQGGFATFKFCPTESGHDPNYKCEYCEEGFKLKKRMAMWFWVHRVLHSTLKQGEQLESVQYNGRGYFQRNVDAPRLWETSAWRESPLEDILFFGAQYGKLRSQQVILAATGSGMARRYKLYTQPGVGEILEEHLDAAFEQCEAVTKILTKSLQTPETVEAPTALPEPVGQPIQAPVPKTNSPQMPPLPAPISRPSRTTKELF